jgi:hypothetical protein
MKSVTAKLILKDWQLYRWQVACSIAAGAIALAITLRGSEPAMVVGVVWFFIALAVVGPCCLWWGSSMKGRSTIWLS